MSTSAAILPANEMSPVLATISAATAIGIGFTYATVFPGSQLWGKVLMRGPNTSRAVALTFDDGPTPGATDAILDVLESHNARATFFVIGANAERHPDLLRRIHSRGHLLANHTYHHAHHGWLGTPRYWRDEIQRTDDIIHQAIGLRPAIFRPPMGIKTYFTLNEARRLGHTTVAWSRRAMDGISTTPERILLRLAELTPGDIVLLHDGIQPHRTRDPRATAEALPRLIDSIRGQNLEPKRLDELLGISGYHH